MIAVYFRLQKRPVVSVVGDTLFTHAGIPPEAIEEYNLVSLDQYAQLNARVQNHRTSEEYSEFWDTEHALKNMIQYRGLFRRCGEVHSIVRQLAGVSRIAVGHTPDFSPRAECDAELLAADSLLGRWIRVYGKRPAPETF